MNSLNSYVFFVGSKMKNNYKRSTNVYVLKI